MIISTPAILAKNHTLQGDTNVAELARCVCHSRGTLPHRPRFRAAGQRQARRGRREQPPQQHRSHRLAAGLLSCAVQADLRAADAPHQEAQIAALAPPLHLVEKYHLISSSFI